MKKNIVIAFKEREGKDGGGKGILMNCEKSFSIPAFPEVKVCYPKICGVLASSAEHAEITDGSVSPTLMARAGTGGNQLPLVAYEVPEMNVYAVENHPNDSRARIDPDGIVQTLSGRMGTGGNNTPFVLIETT